VSAVTLRIVEIRCDEPDCLEAFEGHSGQPVAEVRADSRAVGWVRYSKRGRDYCRDHADQEGTHS
jgi:hypothetical protein